MSFVKKLVRKYLFLSGEVISYDLSILSIPLRHHRFENFSLIIAILHPPKKKKIIIKTKGELNLKTILFRRNPSKSLPFRRKIDDRQSESKTLAAFIHHRTAILCRRGNSSPQISFGSKLKKRGGGPREKEDLGGTSVSSSSARDRSGSSVARSRREN